MSRQKRDNLKRLLEAVPAGFLVDSAWLERHGIGRRSTYAYVKNGWLTRVHRGVFRRPAPNAPKTGVIDWKVCLLSMQYVMGYDVHVGGTSALGQHGFDHYLHLGSNVPVRVYGDAIPTWLVRLPLSAPIETRRTSLFVDRALGLTKDNKDAATILSWDWQLRISSPERAVMEAMDELPTHETFHNLDRIFESLTTLRPRTLSALLHSCKKIKVKRLFFVFADRHDHPWRKRLDAEEFNLGSGDRALVSGGRMHPRYRIMVPEDFVKPEVSDGA
ncbi:type IV toxin-antitoxin system AbiEi family antitoxin [Halorhodospira halochloris]|uniref:type IV toxin-antitoxin system AbiEi family antitoxin domain-containing protein n=1 Tax=Halorhodospira halochloris TaxID=1052 RepID=UPI000BBA9AE2|nr:type IV toxin-antitoxin system AbiEi family antitoxin domain-containing protein [Halorhodospira halochloris]MBK1651918.1 hypothetical protein [Halorhodospira halochloris]MCG5531683.1 type IV toxin-antitoxin system AbiEi family antitoxin [Halorhodospira halochloris]